jgi:hypothetical protein
VKKLNLKYTVTEITEYSRKQERNVHKTAEGRYVDHSLKEMEKL